MNCPICGSRTRVTATSPRYNETHQAYKRYRHCDHCDMYFTTIETYAKDYSAPKAFIKRRR